MMTRLDQLRGLFPKAHDGADRGIDTLVIGHQTNIRYLCGFTGSAGTLVVNPDAAMLVTDGRYTEQARLELDAHDPSIELIIGVGDGWTDVVSAVGSAARVGLEAAHVTWSTQQRYVDDISGRIIATRDLVERLREIKTDAEVDSIRAAAEIADRALSIVRPRLGESLTERDIAGALDATMRSLGADRSGFDTIVASGPNAARPHHQPSDRVIIEGDLVIVDMGAERGSYRSDMSRSFSIGEPNQRSAELLDAVKAAQSAGVAAVAAGVPASEIDAACRDHLKTAGLAEFFTHGTGHGVGLDIHEAPSVSARATATLAPGHIITVEPGVYIPEFGGVRWEDTLLVTSTGSESLTRSDKHTIISV